MFWMLRGGFITTLSPRPPATSRPHVRPRVGRGEGVGRGKGEMGESKKGLVTAMWAFP